MTGVTKRGIHAASTQGRGRFWAGPLPRAGDLLYLADGESFERIERMSGWFWPLDVKAPVFDVIAESGDEYSRVHPAPDKTAILRAAVHDDGLRRAWRIERPRTRPERTQP